MDQNIDVCNFSSNDIINKIKIHSIKAIIFCDKMYVFIPYIILFNNIQFVDNTIDHQKQYIEIKKDIFICKYLQEYQLHSKNNNFKILKEPTINYGSFGVVYSYKLYNNNSLIYKFAIKLPKYNSEAIKAVQVDYKISLKRLNCFNIVKSVGQMIEYAENNVKENIYSTIMDKMDGDLSDNSVIISIIHLADPKFTYIITNILYKIYSVYTCLYNSNYGYSDMKPENCLIKIDKNCIKICFGDLGSIVQFGTVDYGSSYRPLGQQYESFDKHFNLFQFGIMVYYCLIYLPYCKVTNTIPPFYLLFQTHQSTNFHESIKFINNLLVQNTFLRDNTINLINCTLINNTFYDFPTITSFINNIVTHKTHRNKYQKHL